MPTAVDRQEVLRLLFEDEAQLVEVLPQDEYDQSTSKAPYTYR